MESITIADGKYTVQYDNGRLTALRYGEPWRDLTGDNLIYWLMVELMAAKAEPRKESNFGSDWVDDGV